MDAAGLCVSRANLLKRVGCSLLEVTLSYILHTDKVSRVSTIFYFGLEGLGGLEMETDENENVRERS